MGNLPATVTSFIGRGREIETVREQLSASRLVTLVGPGGVGKTRLALEVATTSRRAFADGICWVDLAPVPAGTAVDQAVATELGVREHSTRPVTEQILEFLAGRQLLLVVDNCEHLVRTCATLVEHMLRRCPGLRVLVTGREALGLAGECVCPVPPLTMPDPAQPMPAEALSRYEAVGLLAERASAVQPGFAVTEENREAVAQLCADLDGIPLAIELAATRLRSLSVRQVVDRLTDRFHLLTGGSRAAAGRQRTLRALIDWSYDLCGPVQRHLWARLSVFVGGFDLDAAEEVCAGDGVRGEDVLDLVDGLIARSILVRLDAGSPPRFRMLETIRQYGRDRLAEFGEHEVLRDRHLDYFLGTVTGIADGWCGPGQEAALGRLRADHGNLRAALEWSLTRADGGAAALRMAGALCWHWCADGFLSEGRAWLDQILALPSPPHPARAQALWAAGWVALLQADLTAARRWLEECRLLGEQFHDQRAAGLALNLTGSIAAFSGQSRVAVRTLRGAIDIHARCGDDGPALLARFQLAAELLHLGDSDGAAATARNAIVFSEGCGEHWGRSYALWALARCVWLRGEVEEAWQLTRKGLELQRGFRDLVGAGIMIEQLAWIAASRSDPTWAACLLGTAQSVWHRAGIDVSAFGPANLAHHNRCEQQIRRILRKGAFQKAFEQGVEHAGQDAIDYALRLPAAVAPSPQAPGLTRREVEVAELVGEGLSNRQIAGRLGLSTRTVDGHVQRILAKLGLMSRAQVAAWVAAQVVS